MSTATIRVGTSGWSYDDWDERFYPQEVAKKRWFDYYASRLSTVEINYSFYRLPRTSTVEKWHDRAPDGFRYAVKGSRYITHNRKLADPDEPVANVVDRLAPLRSVLGVWLWQLPPNLHRDVDRLETFLDALPSSARHAVEFRHRSWFDDEVVEVLRRHGVAQVWLSDTQMPDVTPITADFVYVRFHGIGPEDQRYRYDYTHADLRPWADRLREAADDGANGWVFFNNDYRARAPRNAATLVDLLGDAAYPWASENGTAA